MDIIYLGHSSFRINFKSASVVTDPFSKESVGLKYPKVQADFITVSHDHADHNQTQNVEGARKVLKGPGEYDIQGVSIIGIASYHDDAKGEERGKNTIFAFESDDLRVVHLGDLGHDLTEKHYTAMGEVDVLLIPVGGVYTIDPQKASEIARSIEPNVIIPMHFKQAGMNKDFDALSEVEQFTNLMGLKVDKVKKFSLKKIDIIEDDQRIVVFEN